MLATKDSTLDNQRCRRRAPLRALYRASKTRVRNDASISRIFTTRRFEEPRCRSSVVALSIIELERNRYAYRLEEYASFSSSQWDLWICTRSYPTKGTTVPFYAQFAPTCLDWMHLSPISVITSFVIPVSRLGLPRATSVLHVRAPRRHALCKKRNQLHIES